MSAIADRLREVQPPVPKGCAVCHAYAGTLPNWDDEDAAELRRLVDSDTGYKAIGQALKGTGVSADSVRLHRNLKHDG